MRRRLGADDQDGSASTSPRRPRRRAPSARDADHLLALAHRPDGDAGRANTLPGGELACMPARCSASKRRVDSLVRSSRWIENMGGLVGGLQLVPLKRQTREVSYQNRLRVTASYTGVILECLSCWHWFEAETGIVHHTRIDGTASSPIRRTIQYLPITSFRRAIGSTNPKCLGPGRIRFIGESGFAEGNGAGFPWSGT